MGLLDSFVRFDDFLIEKVFTPIAEWVFAHLGITNYRLSKYLCGLTIAISFYEIFNYYNDHKYSTVAVDILLLIILSAVLRKIIHSDGVPPGTASIYRHNYPGRFIVFVLNIITTMMMNAPISTIMMSNLLVLVFYFMACDTPRGDRFVFKTGVRETPP